MLLSEEVKHCWLGRIGYLEALSLQEEIAGRRCTGEGEDILLMLEHPPCYTIGRHAECEDEELGIPLFRTTRGGGITYHGPGQLIGYPIFALGSQRQLAFFVRWIEDSLIEALGAVGIGGEHHPSLRGVWVGGRKIASLGLRFRRGVTQHGFALNVATDLEPFERIVPCGLQGVRMTSIEREGVRVDLEAFAALFARLALPRWRAMKAGELED